jgi:hypothetical protein
MLSIHLRLGLPSGLFPSGFPTKRGDTKLKNIRRPILLVRKENKFTYWSYCPLCPDTTYFGTSLRTFRKDLLPPCRTPAADAVMSPAAWRNFYQPLPQSNTGITTSSFHHLLLSNPFQITVHQWTHHSILHWQCLEVLHTTTAEFQQCGT